MIKSKLQPHDTIEAAKQFLKENWHDAKGAECPCCAQTVKIYSRPITSGMAYALILLHNHTNGEWTHLETLFDEKGNSRTARGDAPKLRFWGLIEAKDGKKEDDGNPNNGYYRITEKGKQFVLGHISVPSHVFIYNNKMYGQADTETDIKKALGFTFNYNKLMEGAL